MAREEQARHHEDYVHNITCGVGISASCNTLFGSPVSRKTNAFINTSWARPLYILAAWMTLFAATRSKRKFDNPVSFDEKPPSTDLTATWFGSGKSRIED